MRRALSTVLAVALLLGLGTLAVLALPNANAPLSAVPAVSAAAPEFEPDAPMAATNFNTIALPLDSSSQINPYTASGLASLVGTGVVQVMHWDAPTQSYQFYFPADGFGTNFGLKTGEAYWLELNSSAGQVVSFVGNVPAQGSIHFSLVGAATCQWNDFSLPLDQSAATNASQLAAGIGHVEQVQAWDASSQSFQFYFPADGFGTNFPVKIGYPYHVCLTQGRVWP